MRFAAQLVATCLLASFGGGHAQGAFLKCPRYGCLSTHCSFDNADTTIMSCSNAIFADDQQLMIWLDARNAKKISEESYWKLRHNLEADRGDAVNVSVELRGMMKSTGMVCFNDQTGPRHCRKILEPSHPPPYSRNETSE